MTRYLLVSFKTCPWVQRAAIVLREKNVAFEFRHIDRDNRPDWFLAISPHKKVPVLRVDDTSVAVRIERHRRIPRRDGPAAAASRRSRSRARSTGRGPITCRPSPSAVTATAYADTEADYRKAVERIPPAFERLERALEKQGSGPYFNGARYALVDAAYAPFLQRYDFLDRVRRFGLIEKFPRLKAWSEALMERPSTHSFPAAEFEAMYRDNVRRRNKWISQFIEAAQVAAE